RQWLARVAVLRRGLLFPLFDRGTAAVRVALILDDGVDGEALTNGLAVGRVCGEVRRDGLWQIGSHDRPPVRKGSLAPPISWTRRRTDRDNCARDFSIEMQDPLHVVALKQATQPVNLVRRPQERVLAVNGRVPALDNILDFTDRFGYDIL